MCVLCCKYFEKSKMSTISLEHASAGIPKHWPDLNDSRAWQASLWARQILYKAIASPPYK